MKRADRPGTAVKEFFARFPDDAACLEHIFKTRWGDHTPCTACGRKGNWRSLKGHKTYIHDCQKATTVLEGTIFFRSQLPMVAWFYTILLFANSSIGVRSNFIRKQLGLGVRSAQRLGSQIRLQMAAMPRPRQLGGPGQMVYVDETLVNNVVTGHLRNQRSQSAIVFGLACGDQIISGIIKDRSKDTLIPLIERFVLPGSTIVSDGHPSYRSLRRRGWTHIVIDHSVSFHDFNGNTSNPIETYWRVLKRSLMGHGTVHDHNLWLYIAENEFRYSRRRSSESIFDILIQQFPPVVSGHKEKLKSRYDWR